MAELREDLIAPCGINCGLCRMYLSYAHGLPRIKGSPNCSGCRPKNKQCAYLKGQCAPLREGKLTYCSECPTFPCAHLSHLDWRYRTRYGVSPLDNLAAIARDGVPGFLAAELLRHRCERCGDVRCMHDGKCYTCDETVRSGPTEKVGPS